MITKLYDMIGYDWIQQNRKTVGYDALYMIVCVCVCHWWKECTVKNETYAENVSDLSHCLMESDPGQPR